MPVPRWIAHVNKRFFNKMELKRGNWPVLTHVGRSSGATYHTPLEAHRVDGRFIFVLMYGSRSDWVQNVLTSGSATLRVGEEEFDLVSPQVVTAKAARRQLPATVKPPPSLLNVTEYLQMDVTS
jgi:deazaflavin-dependent oxidoreductase (nitroreductase family)